MKKKKKRLVPCDDVVLISVILQNLETLTCQLYRSFQDTLRGFDFGKGRGILKYVVSYAEAEADASLNNPTA